MTDEEIDASIKKEKNNWKKRLNRKGPFYLYRLEYISRNDYFVIWNDGYKTKYGSFHDGMYTRYGVNTVCVLNGNTKFDLWNGRTINDDIFDEMLKVREEISELPHFNLDDIKDLKI